MTADQYGGGMSGGTPFMMGLAYLGVLSGGDALSSLPLSQLLRALRAQLSDEMKVGWPDDDELIMYLDRAAATLSERLIKARDPSRLRRLTMNGAGTLPADFASFAGNVPVAVIGRTYAAYAGPVETFYWAKLPPPMTANLYTREEELLIIDLARIYALNRSEYDVTQDLALNIGGR
jgi:hypothetical protein